MFDGGSGDLAVGDGRAETDVNANLSEIEEI